MIFFLYQWQWWTKIIFCFLFIKKKPYIKNPHDSSPVYEALFKTIFITILLWMSYFIFIGCILKGFSVFPIIFWVSYSWSIFPFSSVSLFYMHWHPNPASSEFCNFAFAEHLSTNGFIVVALGSWHLAVQTCRTRTSYFWFAQSWAIFPAKGYVRVALVYNYGN